MALAGEELDPTMKCIKYLLLAFNLIFVLTGILILSIGTTIHAIYHDFQHFLDGSFFSPAVLMIVVGSLIFLIALFGVIGAAKESTCMIMVYSLMLGVILILEVSASIAGYALQGKIAETLEDNMYKSLNLYQEDYEMKYTIDFTQRNLECCGVRGPEDWRDKINPPANVTLENNTIILPGSCCGQPVKLDNGPYYCENGSRRSNGCLPRLNYLISSSAALLAGAAICVSIIQVIGIYFSVTLGRAIRYAKTERERRRQEIREQLIKSYSLLNASDPQKVYPVVYMSGGTNTDSTA